MIYAFLLLTLLGVGLAQAQFHNFPRRSLGSPFHRDFGSDNFRDFGRLRGFRRQPSTFKLCTYSNQAYAKCRHTLNVAVNNSINLPMECVQRDTREACIQSVQSRDTDMVVLTGHDYRSARSRGLTPFIYARESNASVYVAVAPRNISFIELTNAPLDVDQSNHRAFHAAAFFNLQRGHDICSMFNKVLDSVRIKIVDSAVYTPTEDEILICADRSYAESSQYERCNIEAGLQRAVFVNRAMPRGFIYEVDRIFDTILQRFGPGNFEIFNFFSTFMGNDNLIFKNNTIGFDLQPTYRNGVNEKIFNYLHCNGNEQTHDPSQLE